MAQMNRFFRIPPLAAIMATMLAIPAARADQVIADDLIVQGDLCVGTTCTDGMDFFGFDMIVSAENPRVMIADNSNVTNPGGGDTDRDYSFQVNDDTFEFFLIYDHEAGTFPFIMDGGAPTRSINVRANGNIGFGSTGSNTAALTITRGDTPRVRFEQDGSGGNTPHTWDLIANEVQIRIADQTNGVSPFYIYPGTGNEGALTIAGNGEIGMGTYSPQAQLHVTGDQGAAQIRVEETSATTTPRTMMNLQNNGRPEIIMGNTGTGGEWSFGAGTNFILKQGAVGSASSAKTKLFEIRPNGDATLAGSLITGGTACGGGCDRVFSDDYDLPSIAEHAAAMFALGHLPNVGPTPEGEPLNVTDKLGRMLNELEHAHIYIAEQEKRIADQNARIARLEMLVMADSAQQDMAAD
ncbi:hypothetical protein [Marimonas arenosa]|uniref:Uncharacterized protein n=1 Tax=Marimonas arenosa TaxID=1795305 RepID=A0AAE3WGT2_9RHOB|nr:hypothetical protein [Marimonas arenosa]MDQ2092258.1 hypothetical protein [Marimonas arenosa]